MANHRSAKTRIARNKKRSVINGSRRNAVRTFIKKVEAAITLGNKEDAKTALHTAESQMMKAVSNGIFHKNTASRKISRLAQKVKAL